MENCPICLEALKEDVTELEECKHKFHSQCIVKWFRSQHTNCPSCRGQPNQIMSEKSAMCRFRELKKHVMRKNPPKELVQAFKKLEKLKQTIKKRKAARDAIKAQVKKMKKTATIKQFLKQKRKCAWLRYYNDNMKVSDAEYVIGATDFGTDLKPVVSRPMQLVQRVNTDGVEFFTLQ